MDFNSKYCIENPINVAVVGRINLKAGRDVKIGEEVSIYELFGGEEGSVNLSHLHHPSYVVDYA